MGAALVSDLSPRDALLIWFVFFLICFGLGYPTLHRYDPRHTPGLSDAEIYGDLVTGAHVQPTAISQRLLIPWVARPFYRLTAGRLHTWDPVLFGLLVANAIFVAATALTIVIIGLRCAFPYVTSLLGAALFLVNFAVPNLHLAAYVDSGELFFLTLLAWSLIGGRWFLLPVIAIPGSLAKETFAPFAVVFALAWWLADRPWRMSRLVWIAVLGIAAFGTVLAAMSAVRGSFFGPLNFAAELNGYRSVGFVRAILRCLAAREFWYVFAWLLPLSLTRLPNMDRRWLWSVTATFVTALLFGAYNDALGNTTRALFSISGPLLSLAASHRLTVARG